MAWRFFLIIGLVGVLSSQLHMNCSLQQNVDNKGLREQLMNLDIQRRASENKEEDPIIPFGELPTVSKFGAISRTSKTSYQTTGPVQAMASQTIATKPISVTGNAALGQARL